MDMKKLKLAGFAMLVLSVLIFSSCQKKTETAAAPSETNELPYLNYSSLDGKAFSTRELPGKSILILFNTDCDHCQREAQSIGEKINAFKDYEILFVAADSTHHIQTFAKTYGLENKSNVKFGRADYMDVYMNFGSIPTPSIYLYSRERKLIKNFQGETPVEEIVKYL